VQKHFELLEQFKACVDKLGPDTSLWQAPEERDTLLSFLLHACDISNGLRALLLAADWAKRITLGKLLPPIGPILLLFEWHSRTVKRDCMWFM
jgi:hypothetical protein